MNPLPHWVGFGSIDLPTLVIILVLALILFGPRRFGSTRF
jgi:Sec-independent protein translocase protein TatA